MLTISKPLVLQILNAAHAAQNAKVESLAYATFRVRSLEEEKAAIQAMVIAEDDLQTLWLAIKEIDDQRH